MVGVVTDKCIKCKHMDCVEVCPVDAFYEGENMVVINPLECVSCGCCIQQCPVEAIAFDDEPAGQPWRELNAKYAEIWPNITFNAGQTPPDAEQFHNVPDKFERYFSPEPGNGDAGYEPGFMRKTSCPKCGEQRLFSRILRRIRRHLGFGN